MSMFSNPAKWFVNWIFGVYGDGDEKPISSETALSYAPIWYGANKIAGHIAQLPISVFRRVDGGGERQRNHPVAKLMRRPNDYQIPSIFRETVAAHSLLEGNGRAAIVRSGSRITELIPLHPDCTATGMLAGVKLHATRPSSDDRVRLFFDDVSGERGGNKVIMLEDSEVLHIPGLSFNGIAGIPLRRVAQRNLGLSINQEKRLAKQAEQGFNGSLMLTAPPGMFRRAEEAEEFLDYFEKRHNSPEKAGKTGMLREGMTAQILAATNRDAEMIENRKFQRQDAALWLGLEQILGDDSSVSYNGLEQKTLAYLMNCLNRWLKRWEEEMEYKLLTEREFDRDTHYIRFNTAALLKSDYKTSVESLALAISSTIISRNEAREKLDMLPVAGGDVYENPAITPGNTDSQTPPPDDSSSEEQSDNPAMRYVLSQTIRTESNRVLSLAKKADNFLESIENFYESHWRIKLADVAEGIGLQRDASDAHCDQSKALLLDVAGYSTPDNLVENVKKCVAQWEHRAANFGEVCNV